MTTASAPLDTSPSPSPASGARAWWDRPPAVAATYGLVALVLALVGYFSVFTTLVPYDDEGFLLSSLREFLGGGDLYDEVFSQYGPFYYELFGALFELSGRSVTINAGRIVVVGVWVLSALLLGLAAHWLTGRLWLGVVATLAAFATMGTLALEPMHPAGLVTLLLAACGLAAVAVGRWRRDAGLAVLGALGAALALVKINAGGFVLIGAALACVLVLPDAGRTRWPRRLVIAAAIAVPAVLMAPDLNEGFAQIYAAAVTAALVAVVLAAGGRGADGGDGDLRPLVSLVAGAALATVLIFGVIVVVGVSLSGAFDAMVTEAASQREAFKIPFVMDASVVTATLAGIGGALIVRRVLPLAPAPAALGAALRILAGLATLLAVSGLPLLVLGRPEARFAVPLALAWVIAVPPRGERPRPGIRLSRAILAAMAVLQSLHAYPVAGTQISISFFLFTLVGAICVGDGLRELAALDRSAVDPVRRAAVQGAMTAVAIVVLGAAAFNFALRPLADKGSLYAEGTALPFPTADRLHLDEPTVKRLAAIVAALETDCSAFITQPGMNSFHEWTDKPAFSGLVPNWMFLLDDPAQQRLVDQLSLEPRPCVLRSSDTLAFWTRGRAIPRRPLAAYIDERFPDRREFGGGYQLLRPG